MLWDFEITETLTSQKKHKNGWRSNLARPCPCNTQVLSLKQVWGFCIFYLFFLSKNFYYLKNMVKTNGKAHFICVILEKIRSYKM